MAHQHATLLQVLRSAAFELNTRDFITSVTGELVEGPSEILGVLSFDFGDECQYSLDAVEALSETQPQGPKVGAPIFGSPRDDQNVETALFIAAVGINNRMTGVAAAEVDDSQLRLIVTLHDGRAYVLSPSTETTETDVGAQLSHS